MRIMATSDLHGNLEGRQMRNGKPFAMFFNASPRKGWNTETMSANPLNSSEVRAGLGRRIPVRTPDKDLV